MMKTSRGRTIVRILPPILASVCVSIGTAETLSPKSASYDVERKEDSLATACNLALTLTNLPAPELINVRFVAAKEKRQSPIYSALSVDVGDYTFVNGVASKLTRAPLSSASIDSSSFSSAGRLNGGAVDDGGVVLGAMDSEVGRALLASFLTGEFSISFVRRGSPSTRTYTISQAPSSKTQDEFRACLRTIQ